MRKWSLSILPNCILWFMCWEEFKVKHLLFRKYAFCSVQSKVWKCEYGWHWSFNVDLCCYGTLHSKYNLSVEEKPKYWGKQTVSNTNASVSIYPLNDTRRRLLRPLRKSFLRNTVRSNSNSWLGQITNSNQTSRLNSTTYIHSDSSDNIYLINYTPKSMIIPACYRYR